MFKNKRLTIECQFSIKNIWSIKLKVFNINILSANDAIKQSSKVKYYSIRDIMKILNISTTKEVKYLIKKLGLEHSKYRYNKWCYNESAITSLKLYLKYKAA